MYGERILITGANGLLGSEFASAFDSTPIALTREALDITDRDRVRDAFATHKPALVINSAAYTAVDKAEKDKTRAHAINVVGVKHLAAACIEFGSKLVHFSTDQVFDGQSHTPWTETDLPKPLNYYAQTKLESESIAAEVPGALILRVQWLYGRQKPRFLHLKDRAHFSAVGDQFGAPTWSRDVVTQTRLLLNHAASGLFHLSYDDHANWYDIFSFVKETMGFSVELDKVSTESLHLDAARPRYAVLSNAKLRQTLGLKRVGSWKDSLRRFLKEPK